ncbi:GATA zinc finger domain-containing protein 1 [Blomia tropicalis]|nr:GATA zinc finger domain-containing protein 1 [Blomia tropicalis]
MNLNEQNINISKPKLLNETQYNLFECANLSEYDGKCYDTLMQVNENDLAVYRKKPFTSETNHILSKRLRNKQRPLSPEHPSEVVFQYHTESEFIPSKVQRKKGKNKLVIETNEKNQTNSEPIVKRKIFAPYSISLPINASQLIFRGVCYRLGDIVGLVDRQDGKTYYAQIRGFLRDQYAEPSAVITWLLPSADAPEIEFDPATYYYGPIEDRPRKLECLKWICRAPNDFFQSWTVTSESSKGYVWRNKSIPYSRAEQLSIEQCKKIIYEPIFIDVPQKMTGTKTEILDGNHLQTKIFK